MRIAVTGATGLIGGYVTGHLARDHDVVRLGRGPGSDQIVDLSRVETVASLDLRGCDALVHCAGVVNEDFRLDPAAAWLKSTLGMRVLVDRAVEARVGAMAYISTSHVYGPPQGRIDEHACPAPESDYAIAHLACERILARAAGTEQLRGLVLRPNAVFGIPSLETFDRWSLIPYSFPAAAVYDHEIVLVSTGEQRRNFVSAADLASWVDAFLSADAAGYQVVNPIGLDDLSVYDLARKCADIYTGLAGQECTVRRPNPTGREPGADFRYVSQQGGTLARYAVEDYLRTFMCLLMEEWQDGRRYGN